MDMGRVDDGLDIGKGVLWNTFGTIYYYFCQWLLTIIVVRLTDYSQAGYLSLAMTVTSSFYAIAQFGVRQYQVSDVDGKYSDSIYIGGRYITIAASFIACASYAAICNYDATQSLCIMAYMILKGIEAYADVIQGIDQKMWRFDVIGISFFVRGTIVAAGFWIFLYVTGNIILSLLCISVLSLAAVLLIDVKITRKIACVKCAIRDRAIIALLKECVPIVGYNFLLNFVTLIPRNVLQDERGIDMLGIYGSVASPAVVIQLFASVIFNPFMPFFAEYYKGNKRKKFFALMFQFVAMLALIAVISVIAAMIFGKWALMAIIGNKIEEYAYLLIPIIFCTVITAAIWLFAGIMVAIRMTLALLATTVAGFLVSVMISGRMVDAYGMNGVSYTVIASGAVQLALMLAACVLDVCFAGKYKSNKERM